MSLSTTDDEGAVVEAKSEYASPAVQISLQQDTTGQSRDAAPMSITTSPSRSRSLSRPRALDQDTDLRQRRASSRHSLVLAVPDVPTIPAHFLKTGRPASIASPARLSPLPAASTRDPRPSPTWYTTVTRPSTLTEDQFSDNNKLHPLLRSRSLNSRRKDDRIVTTATRENRPPPSKDYARRKSLPCTIDAHRADALSQLESLTPPDDSLVDMARITEKRSANSDYFLEVASDTMADHDQVVPLRRSESRLSQANKRRSLPADALLSSSSDRRPNTSGGIHTSRASSRFGPSDLQQHVDQYRGSLSRTSKRFGDSASVSGLSASGASRSYAMLQDRSPASPSRHRERLTSPELPQYGRRRPSFATAMSNVHQHEPPPSISQTVDSREESPTDSLGPKHTDSTSNESQESETVWDELDDLKSRIKKLELTGKMPATSSAALSGESSDRPHTATTAPTTVDSSPKRERKQITEAKTTSTPQMAEQAQADNTPTTNAISSAHPTLHAALAKAKPLLNGKLFSILEATAADALQLATMTGSAGPQGTMFSAASIINGATTSDRHVRRKADTMCRNLTDLCLALCEGKYERPNVITRPEVVISPHANSPPMSEQMMTQESPLLRHAGSNISRNTSAGRPMSRLEARRTSILGVHTPSGFESMSPRGSMGEGSGSDQESVPPQNYPQQRISRAPSKLRSRMQYSDQAGSDDDPTVRPPSRAMTDIGAPRSRSRNMGNDRSPISPQAINSRASLSSRRNNDSAFGMNRDMQRVSSDSRYRRHSDHQAPPSVMEEEDSPLDYLTPLQARRRVTSSGQFSSRRSTAEFGRSSSLRRQQQFAVE